MLRKTLCALVVSLAVSASAFGQSVLKGHDTEQPIDISAERLEVKQKTGQAIFKGTVIVSQGKMTFAADTLTVYYDTSDGTDNPTIERLDARGNVKLTSETESVSSEWSVYDVSRRLVTMGGAVKLSRKGSSLEGERLELDLVSGLTKLDGNPDDDGRVTGTFKVPDTPND
ncbi:lipopolysaccharide transport periplasmic protein LptA [Kordiimonas sediminis]|nr:lipopolysaccharide transport periplasmic protein LptA [Kordiimonas sediminis]